MARSSLYTNQAPGFGTTVEDHSLTTGNRWYVNSASTSGGTTSGYGATPDRPFTTIAAAITAATASNGDIVYVLPGHAESKTSAGALFTASKAGLRLQGLGWGSSLPTLTLGHASADIEVTAANVWIDGFRIIAAAADITRAFDIQAANARFGNLFFRDSGANDNFVDYFDVTSTTDNAADGLWLHNLDVLSDDTGNDGLVEVNGDIQRLRVEDCIVRLGVATESLIGVATGKDLQDLVFARNYIYRVNTDTALIANPDTTTANTGIITDNRFGHADPAGEVLVTAGTAIRFFNNLATAVNDGSGYLLPAADS